MGDIHETGSFEAKIRIHPEISVNISVFVEDIDSVVKLLDDVAEEH